MTAVVYLRSACPNLASIRSQRERCEELAREHGFELTDVYTDVGPRRLALQALTDDVAEKRFAAVFVSDLSRLGRTNADFTRTAKVLRDAGCSLYDASHRNLVDLTNLMSLGALVHTLAAADHSR